MRFIAAAVIAAFLAGPALAQQKPIPRYGEEDKAKTPEEKQQEREAEKAYRRSVGKESQDRDDFELSGAGLPAGHDRNADQIAFWNGVAGRHWTERQTVQDIVLAPVTERLLARIDAQAGQRILDIGCGCGAIAI